MKKMPLEIVNRREAWAYFIRVLKARGDDAIDHKLYSDTQGPIEFTREILVDVANSSRGAPTLLEMVDNLGHPWRAYDRLKHI